MIGGIRCVAVCACLVAAGCGTTDLNPASPRAHTGYVDFYTDSDMDLCWDIKRATEPSGEMKSLYSEYEPVPTNILRLSAPPGAYRFKVWFNNLASEGSQTVSVTVANGMITPVHVTLTASGTTSINTKEYGFRGSAKGYGRGTKIRTRADQVYRIGAVAESAQEYRHKERMPYFAHEQK